MEVNWLFVCKIFISMCYISKYSKVHLRLVFTRFLCCIYRHLNKNKPFIVPYNFWKLSTVWVPVSLFLTNIPLLGLAFFVSILLSECPLSVSFLSILFPKKLFSHLFLLYAPLPLVAGPFPIFSLTSFFLLNHPGLRSGVFSDSSQPS